MESCCHGDHGWQRKQNEERERENGKQARRRRRERGTRDNRRKEGREEMPGRQVGIERTRKRSKDPPGRWESV